MKAWVDANPKTLCYVLEDGRKKVEPLSGPHTSNEAEYKAVLFVLQELGDTYIEEIFSDSMLVVQQLNGRWAIRNPNLLKLAQEVWDWLAKYRGRTTKFTWVPREENPAGRILG